MRCCGRCSRTSPKGEVTAAPVRRGDAGPAGAAADLLAEEGRQGRGRSATYDAGFPGRIRPQDHRMGLRFHDPVHSRRASPSTSTCPTRRSTSRRSPTREYAGKTKRGNWADILTQMDDFTGVILDKLDELGIAEDTIVVWASDNGADPTYRFPADRPGPGGRPVERVLRPLAGRAVHLAGGLQPDAVPRPLAREGARRQGQQRAGAPGRLLHHAGARPAAATVPADRQIDGMDMSGFLLGDAAGVGPRHHLVPAGQPAAGGRSGTSGRFTCSTRTTSTPPGSRTTCRILYNLEWDPREEHQVDFPHAWVLPPHGRGGRRVPAARSRRSRRSSRAHPTRTCLPGPASCVPQTHLQIGPIIQYITTLVRSHDELPDPGHGIEHQSG